MKTQYARKQENPLFQNYPDEQVLSDLDLLKDGKLNYAALILLGKSEAIRKYLPQNNIVVGFRMYHSMIQYTARKEFQLPLFIAIDKASTSLPAIRFCITMTALIYSIYHLSTRRQSERRY